MIHRGRSAVALAAMLLLAGFSGLSGPRTVTAVSPASLASGDPYDVGAAELERILNYERVQDGLPALRIDTFLTGKTRDGAVACPGDASLVMQGRAKDIALHEFLDEPHQLRLCPAKSSLDAMTAWGYSGPTGEIIAFTGAYDSANPDTNTDPSWYRDDCGDPGSPACVFLTYRTVSRAATGFMDHPPHRDIVLGAYDRFACGAWIAPTAPRGDDRLLVRLHVRVRRAQSHGRPTDHGSDLLAPRSDQRHRHRR